MRTDPTTDPTEDRVRRALRELADPIDTTPPPLTASAPGRAGASHTRRRFIAAGTLVGMAAAAGFALVVADGDDDSGITTGTDPWPAPTTATADSRVSTSEDVAVTSTVLTGPSWLDSVGAGEVRTLPVAPIEGRIAPAAVWTGSEMIVWGGSALVATGERPLDDGAAFSPHTGTWRLLAAAPVQGRSYPAVVWTGAEMVVWGGSRNGTFVGDGAAYNPATDTWRTLPIAPIPGAMKSAVAWTGSEMFVVGGLNGTGAAAAYDPTSDTWRRIADAPGNVTPPYAFAVWTGEVVLVPITNDAGNQQAVLASYQPTTGTWTTHDALASQFLIGTGPPGQPNETSIVLSFQADMSGTRLDRTGEAIGALTSRPADAPLTPAWQPIWTGHQILMWAGGAVGTTYDPATDGWGSFPAGDLDPRTDGAAVWADNVLLTWGGFPGGASSPTVAADDGIVYRPPATP